MAYLGGFCEIFMCEAPYITLDEGCLVISMVTAFRLSFQFGTCIA